MSAKTHWTIRLTAFFTLAVFILTSAVWNPSVLAAAKNHQSPKVHVSLQSLDLEHEPATIEEVYDAGSDVHVDDALGRLSITTEGLYRRDHGVISRIRAAGIPCATVIGGGYDKDRARVAARHGVVVSAAAAVLAGDVRSDSI